MSYSPVQQKTGTLQKSGTLTTAIDLRLHPRQSQAFTSTATEILYGGAAGGGKSHLMRVAAIAWCVAIPGLQVYLFRRTYPELVANHLDGAGAFPALLAPWIATKWVSMNLSNLEIQFGNGSKIHLCHCQHEKDRFKYQGAEIHALLMDELTHFTPTIYKYLRGRVRLGGLPIPAEWRGLFPRILAGSNPGGVGHNWVKAEFVDNAAEGAITAMAPEDGGMRRQFIRALLEDNPTLLANDPDYENRLAGLGDPALVRAMRLGDWDIVSGGMFDDVFSRSAHVLTPFPLPDDVPVYRSFDWGSSRPFSVGWWAVWPGGQTPDGRYLATGTMIRVGEWYGWNGKPNEGCKKLARDIAAGILERERAAGWNVQPGPADSAIYAEENGNCIARDLAAGGAYFIPSEKGAGSRKAGWEKMRQYLAAALQSPMEMPGLVVFENCIQWLRTVPTLPRDEKNRDDVDTDAEDHAADETRYMLMGAWGKGNAW